MSADLESMIGTFPGLSQGRKGIQPMSYTTSQIAELFPDLVQIRDAGLRDNVAAVERSR